jgi:hypothetical protein
LGGALKDGGAAVAIATERNASGIVTELRRMGLDPSVCIRDGSFALLDSTEMLSRFFIDGVLHAELFDRTVGAMMRETRARVKDKPLGAFGDMVGVLWLRGEREAAVELERLWNTLQQRVGFELYCAYPIDVFSRDFCAEELEGVFATHTLVFPSASGADLGRALDRAMDDVLGERAKELRLQMRSHPSHVRTSMPKAEQMILWIRTHAADVADAVIQRTRELYSLGSARVYLR